MNSNAELEEVRQRSGQLEKEKTSLYTQLHSMQEQVGDPQIFSGLFLEYIKRLRGSGRHYTVIYHTAVDMPRCGFSRGWR